MQKHRNDGLLPDSSDPDAEQIRRIADFWNAVRVCEETGSSSRESLATLERVVSDCLYQKPPNIVRAEAVTAQALCLIAGCGNP